jgi:hypothetical protein
VEKMWYSQADNRSDLHADIQGRHTLRTEMKSVVEYNRSKKPGFLWTDLNFIKSSAAD